VGVHIRCTDHVNAWHSPLDRFFKAMEARLDTYATPQPNSQTTSSLSDPSKRPLSRRVLKAYWYGCGLRSDARTRFFVATDDPDVERMVRAPFTPIMREQKLGVRRMFPPGLSSHNARRCARGTATR
jgi:hypothetical protein